MYTDNNIVKHIKSTNTYEIMLNDISCDKSYGELVGVIQSQYDDCNHFNLVIDTINLEQKQIRVKYLYELSCYITKLKKLNTAYLMQSKIYVYDEFTNNLLYTLFTFMTKPIAPVHVILYKNRNKDYSSENIKNYSTYYP